MKLIQYRFTSQSASHAQSVARTIWAFLNAAKDFDLSAIYSDPGVPSGVRRVEVNTGNVVKVLSESFVQSYLEHTDLSKSATIKSNVTCRFVVFEDDGLLRIGYASADEPIAFGDMVVSTEDASELVITTDLFDFS